MTKFFSLALMAALASASSLGMAQQSGQKVKSVTMEPTAPGSGKQMYTAYCAACHGASGKGDGPAAKALKVPPTDLTLLSQKNKGTFPVYHVTEVLRNGVDNPAHGTSDMPIWGDLMKSLHSTDLNQSAMVNQRITNLAAYLKTIQK